MFVGARRTRAAKVAVLVTFAFVAATLMSSFSVVAPQVGPLTVFGYVKDDAGRTMAGIPVVVVSMNGTIPVATKTTTSDPDGFYMVTFAGGGIPGMDGEWDIGFIIRATAQSGITQVTEQVTVTSGFPLIQIDLQFPFEISQFGSWIGFFAAAAIIGVVAVVFLPKRLKGRKS